MKFIYFLLCAFSACSLSLHGLEGDKAEEQKGNYACLSGQYRGADSLIACSINNKIMKLLNDIYTFFKSKVFKTE